MAATEIASDPEKRAASDINPATGPSPGDDDPISKHHITDETGDLAASALSSAPLSEAESKAVLRKIDLRYLVCVTNGLITLTRA